MGLIMILRSMSGMQQAIRKELAEPFCKGARDCLSFCLAAISGLGVSVKNHKSYDGSIPTEPVKSFKDFCNDQGWRHCQPNDSDTGTIALCKIGDEFFPAVHDGDSFLARTPGGLFRPPKSSICLTFRTVI